MTWLGEFPEDFTTVVCMFTTHDGNGAPVAPLSAFEAADIAIYKNGNAAQKTTTNGVTMTSPFDSVTGLHAVVIDTSNDTGDSGFWTTGGGSVYTIVLVPDTETVNSQTVTKIIGQFGIALSPALRPTVAGRTLDVSSTGEAGVDWANVGSPTTTVGLSGTTIATSQVVASVSGAVGSVTGAVGSVTGLTASDVGAIKAKTDNLPASPAAVGSAMTLTAAYDFAKGTVAVTESYAADGAAPTPVQSLMLIQQQLGEMAIAGTTMTVKKVDGLTTAATFTLDSATSPTSITRAT